MRRTRSTLLALLVPVAALGVACSSGGDEDGAEIAGDRVESAPDAAGAGDGDGDGGGDAAATGGSAAQLAQLGRSVIRTAELSIVVDDVEAAAAEAVAVAQRTGGFQASGHLDLAADEPTGAVVVRVPSAAFAETLDALARLGEVADQRIDSEDVTGAVVDLESRIIAARASVDRVRAFLHEAGNVADLAAVERELLTRESELEALVGQLEALEDQVELATITVRLGAEEPPALASEPQPSDDIPAPARALRHGWVVLLNVLQVGAAAVAFALPLALLAVPAVVGWRLVQRRARRLAG